MATDPLTETSTQMMSTPTSSPLAFTALSTFTPATRQLPTVTCHHVRTNTPRMTLPHSVKRSQEIEKIQKQLAELRAQRERISRKTRLNVDSTSTPSSPPPPSPPPVASVAPAPVEDAFALNKGRSSPKMGKHGEGSRFLSISKVEAEEYFPRILTVAGHIPGLKFHQYRETPSVLQNRAPSAGNLFLTMLPEGYNGQIVALPGIEAVGTSQDPVAVLVSPNTLSASPLPVAEGDDVVLIVERNVDDVNFEPNMFYLWQVGEDVEVGWLKENTPDVKMIGKVIYGMIEVQKDMRDRKSCWEEANETYSM